MESGSARNAWRGGRADRRGAIWCQSEHCWLTFMPPIRILVVDDSLVIRKVVSEALKSDPAFEVAGTAGAGRMALIRIPTLQGRSNIFVSKAHGLALGFIEGDSVLVRQ